MFADLNVLFCFFYFFMGNEILRLLFYVLRHTFVVYDIWTLPGRACDNNIDKQPICLTMHQQQTIWCKQYGKTRNLNVQLYTLIVLTLIEIIPISIYMFPISSAADLLYVERINPMYSIADQFSVLYSRSIPCTL